MQNDLSNQHPDNSPEWNAGLVEPAQLLVDNQPFLARLAARACRRKGLSPQDTEDFTSQLNVKLLEDDCRVLREFEGRSSLKTYLTIVVQRSLLDYLDHLWGKWRPSAAAKRLGPLAIQIEKRTVRDGLTTAQAIDTLLRTDKAFASEAQLEALAEQLPVRYRRRVESDDQLERMPSATPSAQEQVERKEWEQAHRRLLEVLREVLVELPDEDAAILQMLPTMSVAQIARSLYLEQKPLYRRRDQLLADVRERMIERGVRPEDIQDYFGYLDEH
jgi:RNA polymerase sigma factor for flagellar operon FliA